jgi:hypothetical protein
MTISPFKFLEAYSKEDSDFFFGREKETAQLFNAVHASNLTLLYGASGTGKTSLINCGLANKFYDTDWLPLFIRRGNNINDSLHAVLNKTLEATEETPEKLPLLKKVDILFLDYFKPIYLIFDQFEELFIFSKKDEITGKNDEQETFYAAVKSLLETAGLHVKIIFSIREEWIAYLNDFEKVLPYLFDNRLRVEKMNNAHLFEVIVGTLHHLNVKISEPVQDTVEAILNNIRDKKEGVELTNLQVYLDRLYRKAAENHTGNALEFTPSVIKAVGAMENVLSGFLDEELDDIEAQLKQRGVENPKNVPLEILFTMVTKDGTKQAMPLEDILDALPRHKNFTPDNVAFCIEAFKRIRILRETE